jgi:hypothetical protein
MQGYPANASDSRSFVVADSRARTQVANVTAAVFVAVTLMVLTRGSGTCLRRRSDPSSWWRRSG